MCLYNEKIEVERLLRAKDRGQKFIWGYKEIKLSACNNINSLYFHKIWKPGINKSNSRYKKPCLVNCTEINYGIHVYLRFSKNFYVHDRYNIIKVKCYLKDLIGCDSYTAVFKQVELSRKEYDKVKKELMNNSKSGF